MRVPSQTRSFPANNTILILDIHFLFIHCADCTKIFLNKEEPYRNYMHSILSRIQLQRSIADKVEGGEPKKLEETTQVSLEKKVNNNTRVSKYSSDDEDQTDSKWKLELAWLTRALEPALQLCRRALPTGLLTLEHVSSDEVRQQL